MAEAGAKSPCCRRSRFRETKRVLDAGCGLGWRSSLTQKNSPPAKWSALIFVRETPFKRQTRATAPNAAAEGVADRVEVETGISQDCRSPTRLRRRHIDDRDQYPLARWARSGAARNCRVLKPGGRLRSSIFCTRLAMRQYCRGPASPFGTWVTTSCGFYLAIAAGAKPEPGIEPGFRPGRATRSSSHGRRVMLDLQRDCAVLGAD